MYLSEEGMLFKQQQKSKIMNKQILLLQLKWCFFSFCFAVDISIGHKVKSIWFLCQISLFTRLGDLLYCEFPLHLEMGLVKDRKGKITQAGNQLGAGNFLRYKCCALILPLPIYESMTALPFCWNNFQKSEWLSFQL